MYNHHTYTQIIIKDFFSVHSIKMSNISQNNGIEGINKEVSLLKERLKINEKSLISISSISNASTWVRRLRLKQGQKTNLSETKKMQEVLKEIFKNKIKLIKMKKRSTKKCPCKCTKKKEII